MFYQEKLLGARDAINRAHLVGSWATAAAIRRPRQREVRVGAPAAAARTEAGRTGVARKETEEEGAVWWWEDERKERNVAAVWAAAAMAGGGFGGIGEAISERESGQRPIAEWTSLQRPSAQATRRKRLQLSSLSQSLPLFLAMPTLDS
jgi:hypothetical protein